MEALGLCGGFKLRLAAAEDADAATVAFLPQRVAIQSTFGAFDFHLIIEMSIYSFVILNGEEKLVAFCSFNDSPAVPGIVPVRRIPDAKAWAKQEASDLGFLTDSLLWLEICTMCSLTEEEKQRAISAFMRVIFTLCPDIQAVLHPSPANSPVYPQLFKMLSRTPEYGLLMCACLRSTVLPTMKIRRAEVEDNDELLPVIERAQARGSPLAQVPEVAIPSQPYAVARLIAAQDMDNTVFVAEVGDKIIGIMAITARISNDYCFNFNTDDYDGLTGKVTKRFEFTVEEPVGESDKPQDSSLEATPGSTPASTPTPDVATNQAGATPLTPTPPPAASPAPSSPAATSPALSSTSPALPVVSNSPPPSSVPPATPVPVAAPSSVLSPSPLSRSPALSSPSPAPPSPSPPPASSPSTSPAPSPAQDASTISETSEVKSEESSPEPKVEKVRVIEVEVPVRITNAFQISMLCIEEEFENQGIDFVMSAFELETRDYCLVGFPYTARIHPLLRLFARVPCRSSRKIENMKLPETRMMTDLPPDPKIAHLCLYLLHRDSLAPGFEVRRSVSHDAEVLTEFLADFKDYKSIVDLVEHPRKGCHTIVAVLSAQIVGLAMIEDTVPVEALTTHFCIKSFVNLEHYPPANQGCITLLALSPLFRHRRRLFLREIMRLTDKTLLYCPIFPDQDLPDVIEDMLLIPARQHVYMSASEKWGRHPETIGPSKRALRRGSVANFSPRGLFSGFDCALYFTTHRFTSRYRIPVNSRILVAGASRTAEAFLHKLIANPQMHFTNVTLVSPCGFKGFCSSAASILDVESGPARCFSKLGIDCQVGLKSSVVVDFDREAQTITLKSGEVISYDLFVMTTGMQDQTSCKLGISGVKEVVRADEFLASLHSIIASLEKLKAPREVLGDNEGHAVVYGATLEAFYVVQLLLSRGVRGSNIILCHAEKKLTNQSVHGDANILNFLLEDLAWSQVVVKPGLKLIGVTTNSSGALKAVTFEALGEDEDDDKVHHEVLGCLLVTCDRKQVDVPLFNVMRRENIIFDGRVVVDGKFQTNDPFIYAAGTICKFSRNCGKLPKLETFCSQEVGEALSASLVCRFKSHLPDVGKLWLSYFPWYPEKPRLCDGTEKWPAPATPLLGRPKCTGGVLPGGVQLFSIVLPSCHTTNWDDLRVYSMLTKFSNFYARVDITENKQLARILYAGKVKTDAWKFSQIVGLPVSLLNSLPRRYSDGSLNDIVNFLLQPWSSVLFHDEFLPFYSNLTLDIVHASKSHPKGGGDVSFDSCDKLEPELAEAISKLVRKELLKFIEKHRLELPMYTLPRKKVDLRLLLPRVISSDDVEIVEKKKQRASAVAAAASAALVAAADLINAAFDRLIQQAEREENDRKTIKEIIDQLVQGMEDLKPVLLTLKGEGYIGPTVDNLVKEIEKKVLSISVWDENLDLEGREDEQELKRAIEGMIGLLEQSSPVVLALDRVD